MGYQRDKFEQKGFDETAYKQYFHPNQAEYLRTRLPSVLLYHQGKEFAEISAKLSIHHQSVRKYVNLCILEGFQELCTQNDRFDTYGKRNSPDLLLNEKGERLFKASAPNQVWYSDITYLPIQEGSFTYLCVWTDLFSRKIVGWQIEENTDEWLVMRSLEKALKSRQPEKGLILHLDRGGQYVSGALRKVMKKWHCRQSMSRADNCYDNAVGESLFSPFKAELIQNGTFLRLEDVRTEIFEYIEIYYNRIRRHSSLGYESSEQFEEKCKMNIVSLASPLSH